MSWFYWFSSLACILFSIKANWRKCPRKCVFRSCFKPLSSKGPFWLFANLKKGKIKLTFPHPSTQYFYAFWATSREHQTPQLWLERSGEECGLFCSLKREVSTIFFADCGYHVTSIHLTRWRIRTRPLWYVPAGWLSSTLTFAPYRQLLENSVDRHLVKKNQQPFLQVAIFSLKGRVHFSAKFVRKNYHQ